MENQLKYKIANKIGDIYVYAIEDEQPTYEQLLNAIHKNDYRTIYKMPAKTFIIGIIQSFKLEDNTLEKANKILKAIKEVVQEALELNGIELTFTDEDWNKLEVIEGDRWHRLKINTNKLYMSEFFELS